MPSFNGRVSHNIERLMKTINRFQKRVASTLRGITFALIWEVSMINIAFFLKIGRFILLPLNAAINVFLILFTLYELYKKRSKENLINAVFEAITGACIIVGCIGSLIIGGPFEILIVPIVLITCFSLRSFKSIYDLNRHHNTFNEQLPNILNISSGMMSVALIVLISFAGLPVFGILGVFAGLLSATAAILLLMEQRNKHVPVEAIALENDDNQQLGKLAKDLQETSRKQEDLKPYATSASLCFSSLRVTVCSTPQLDQGGVVPEPPF